MRGVFITGYPARTVLWVVLKPSKGKSVTGSSKKFSFSSTF